MIQLVTQMTLNFKACLSGIQTHKSKGWANYDTLFLDLEPMTLLLKFDLDMAKVHLCSENEAPSFSSSNVST